LWPPPHRRGRTPSTDKKPAAKGSLRALAPVQRQKHFYPEGHRHAEPTRRRAGRVCKPGGAKVHAVPLCHSSCRIRGGRKGSGSHTSRGSGKKRRPGARPSAGAINWIAPLRVKKRKSSKYRLRCRSEIVSRTFRSSTNPTAYRRGRTSSSSWWNCFNYTAYRPENGRRG
jgi:hypothetical protein